MRIMALVEVVLGPLMTFVVYAPGKRRLKQDLAIIGIVQISAFVIGLSIIYSERPLAISLTGNTFYSTNRVGFDFYGQKPDFLDKFAGSFPKYVYVTERKAKPDSLMEILKTIPDRLLESSSSPLSDHIEEVIAQGITAEGLATRYPNLQKSINLLQKKYSSKYPKARYYRLIAKNSVTYCLFDAPTSNFLDLVSKEETPP